MKAWLVDYLACPSCCGRLDIPAPSPSSHQTRDDNLTALHCARCSTTYPIRNGIPRFPINESVTTNEKVVRTRDTYDFTWQRFGAPETKQDWEKDSYQYQKLIPSDIFDGQNQVGLDAGCGGGADLIKFWRDGVKVIGFDLSTGVDAIAQIVEPTERGALVQGDLHLLPFQRNVFDFVYSFGVLHHLPDPQRGLEGLVKLLKPGAPIVTYLYEKFETQSGWVRFSLWIVNHVRRVTSRLSPPVLLACCWLVVPFIWLMFSLPARITAWMSPNRVEPWPFSHTIRWPVLAADLFDRFAPPVEHRFTQDEVKALYAKCGLERVEVRRYRGWVCWGFKTSETMRDSLA